MDNKKRFARSFIAWVIAFFLSANSAQALVALTGMKDVEKAMPAHAYYYEETVVTCRNESFPDETFPYHFYYRQLIAIRGFGAVWAPVDLIYSTRPKEATEETISQLYSCEDENGDKVHIYELGPSDS